MVNLFSHTTRRMMPIKLQEGVPSGLVVCNVYTSAGGKKIHGPFLTSVLAKAQAACNPFHQHNKELAERTAFFPDDDPVAVVAHAYTDPVYNRTSFHLAGHTELVATVATDVVINAVTGLRKQEENKGKDDEEEVDEIVAHPYIGLVDHVAVMPLPPCYPVRDYPSSAQQQNLHAAGELAKHIGATMEEQLGIKVFYYGAAHPEQKSLADVRRQETNFFKSGALSSSSSGAAPAPEAATVGAPDDVVENYNILLSSKCTKKMAQSLARRVRERDGGLKGVEALTLPYSNGRYEVACNLLRPSKFSTTDDIEKVVNEWEGEHKEEENSLVEKQYRVGVSMVQCLSCLKVACSNLVGRKMHDLYLQAEFSGYVNAYFGVKED